MPGEAIEPRDCTCTSCRAAPRRATSICWEQGPALSPHPAHKPGEVQPHQEVIQVCVSIKQKNTWANQSQNADCCCILNKKVQSLLQSFCLLTSTKLISPRLALAQMHPPGTAPSFLAPPVALSSEELALPLSSLLFTCTSSFLGAFLQRWQPSAVAIPDMLLSKERKTFFYD